MANKMASKKEKAEIIKKEFDSAFSIIHIRGRRDGILECIGIVERFAEHPRVPINANDILLCMGERLYNSYSKEQKCLAGKWKSIVEQRNKEIKYAAQDWFNRDE